MARGFLIGAVWGTVVAGVGGGALSVAMGPPDSAQTPPAEIAQAQIDAPEPVAVDAPSVAAVDAPPDAVDTGSDAAKELDAADAAPEESAPEPAPAMVDAPPVNDPRPGRRPAPEPGVDVVEQDAPALDAPAAPAIVGADTSPLAPPDVGAAPEPPADAAAGPTAPGAQVAVTTEGPVLPNAQAAAPGLADPQAAPDAVLAPQQPPPPPIPSAQTALVPQDEAPAEDVTSPDAVVDAPVPATPEGVAQAPAAPQEAPEPAPADAPDLAQDTPAEGPVDEDVVAQAERPQIGQPAGSLLDRGGAVMQSRLPRIGAEEATDAPQPAALGAATPLVQFAAPADPAAGVPRVSVVLIDDGSGPLGPAALEAFPFPVSFAIDPGHPDPAAAAAAYRGLGFEVMALADVPDGAQASDVEVIMAAILERVPEAVAVLEDPAGGLQSSREVSSQAASYLAATGHGLVMMPKGLNTAQQLAARAGVPSVSVFRDFDGEGQDARVIRRFLDQSAFRARQEGSVVMLGRLRADTVSALVLWGLQDRASQVALVPVSVVLREAAGL